MRDDAFQVVPMHVARNPVARAIAMAKMRDAVRTFQLRLYFVGNEGRGSVPLD